MGSGLSTKYVLHTYQGVLEVRESELEYRRVFDEDYLDEFCRDMIERPKEDGSSIDGNYLKVQAKYPLRTGGNLGEGTGKAGFNNWYSDNPIQDAMEMFSDLSNGGSTVYSGNEHGIIATFGDKSNVMFRPYTSTEGSPAVDIRITNPGMVRGQKIHFILSRRD